MNPRALEWRLCAEPPLNHHGAHRNAWPVRARQGIEAMKHFSRWWPWVALLALLCAPARAADDWEAHWLELQAAVEHHPAQAAARAEHEVKQARERGDKPAELDALNLLSLARAGLGETADHADDERRGMQLAKELGDLRSQCWYLDGQAWASEYDGKTAEAAATWDQAIALAERNGFEVRRAWIYLSRGGAVQNAGNKAEAMSWLSRGYDIFERHHNPLGAADVLGLFGDVYGGAGAPVADQAKAAAYYERALARLDRSVHRRLSAHTLLRLGVARLREGKPDEARRLLTETIAIAQAIGFRELAGGAEFHLGTLEMAQANDSAALAGFDRARDLLGHQPNPTLLVRVQVNRAELLARAGRRDEARAALAAGRHELDAAMTPSNEAYFLPRAAEVLYRLGEPAQAVAQLRAAREADKRLAEAQNAKLGEELRVRFQVELKEAENAALRSQQREADSRRLVLILALALALLMAAGIALWLRKRAESQRTLAEHHLAVAEAQAARADAQAAANEAKSRFLATMSHELRSPLNAMLGFTRLLLRAPGLAAHADDLGIVLRSGEHLHGLINQVLEMSKIEAGHAVVVEGDFDLAALVEEVLEMQRPAASQKALDLRLEAHDKLARGVRGDATKLRQVLVNLVGNAVKFTDAGSVTLHISPEGPRWHFAVRDTGVGIAAHDLARLGHAFVQAEAGRRAAEGTGLGLAISRRLVALMGGELRLASTPGQGTEAGFSLDLPPAQQPQAPEPPASPIVRLAPGTAPQRVLIVEDRPEGRLLLRRTLQPLGFELREAGDGDQALDTWQAWQPQLVLMDIQMAGMDGHEATRRIKATELGRNTVVIALTASCFEEQRDEVLASGCDDFMRKPFQEAALLEMIARHLRISYVNADAAAPAEVDPARIALLPPDLREALQAALQQLDVGAVEQALARLREHDTLTADAMAVLASSYRYDALLSYLTRETQDHEPQDA
jgi:signal transduction histidine kinase/DNA-binding response OmpR family regulator